MSAGDVEWIAVARRKLVSDADGQGERRRGTKEMGTALAFRPERRRPPLLGHCRQHIYRPALQHSKLWLRRAELSGARKAFESELPLSIVQATKGRKRDDLERSPPPFSPPSQTAGQVTVEANSDAHPYMTVTWRRDQDSRGWWRGG